MDLMDFWVAQKKDSRQFRQGVPNFWHQDWTIISYGLLLFTMTVFSVRGTRYEPVMSATNERTKNLV